MADSELRLEITALPSLPEVRPGDDLGEFIARAAPDDLADSHVIAVAHKVVSKAEGRVRVLEQVTPADRARSLAADQDKDPRHMQVILDETQEVLRAEGGVMICEPARTQAMPAEGTAPTCTLARYLRRCSDTSVSELPQTPPKTSRRTPRRAPQPPSHGTSAHDRESPTPGSRSTSRR